MKSLIFFYLLTISLKPLPAKENSETCSPPYVHDADTAENRLVTLLREKLFGQHLVHLGLISKIRHHLLQDEPKSPLTISLHGWPGSGKSLTAEIVASSMYAKGVGSSFVKIFTASNHFPDPERVKDYRQLVNTTVMEIVKRCPRALFVFDEVDKLPSGLLDVLVPLISHTGSTLDGINYKKSIYLFLGNAGSDSINNITLEFLQNGKWRTDLTINHFHDILSNEAFNSTGGWYTSELITRILVDWFIPYLPLERRHIIQCFKSLAEKETSVSFSEEELKEMANQMSYWPEDNPIFSRTGCKRAENIFLFEVASRKFRGRNEL